VIGDLRQVLANGFPGALVIGLSQDGRPSILEEVEGFLTVEGEHLNDVGRIHSISEELDSVTWCSLGIFWGRLECLCDSQKSVLGTTENTSVGSIRVRDQLDLGVSTHGMGPLHTSWWHHVANIVVAQIHVLCHSCQ